MNIITVPLGFRSLAVVAPSFTIAYCYHYRPENRQLTLYFRTRTPEDQGVTGRAILHNLRSRDGNIWQDGPAISGSCVGPYGAPSPFQTDVLTVGKHVVTSAAGEQLGNVISNPLALDAVRAQPATDAEFSRWLSSWARLK